ncbi:TPA: hypothetical protein ENG04_12900 [Candidatus Poribacteria bacterium]|nr:hypothetical protein [Candidatus Poribacteria bacterium]HEX30971.1 hypothetical protein [Candidatus Poribacteria bacterium]
MRDVRELLSQLRDIEPPEGLKERILLSTVRRSRLYRLVALASAAAIVVGLALGLFLGGLFVGQNQAQKEAVKLLEGIRQTSRPLEESSMMLLEAIVLTMRTTSMVQSQDEEVVKDEGI